MKMLLVLQLICLVFLSGGQAETLGADVEGSSYAEVEEILLGAQVEQLRKENLNLIENIQIQDKQLENMRTLEIINKNLTQENIENMEKNQLLKAENIFQANQIVQLKEKLQSKETMLQNNLTKTIQDLHNATMQARKFESLLQAELQSKSTHIEDAQLERQRHEITKQELEDLKVLVIMSMNLTRIQNKRTSKLENITASMDMDQSIRKMKEKEILYLADIQAYQNEILILRNATHEENDQKERLKIAITQQSQLGESNERMLRFLTSVIVNMTTSIHNCSTITTDAQQVQLRALLEKEDTMKQIITQCSMFNASSIALQNHYIQVNSQLKDQLGIKNNVIRHHIDENKERSNDLEETKQLTKIQSEALEIMTEEMERFIPDDFNSRTIVRRSADGTIKSASLCQCIPETPDESELELTSIEWSCPLDKAIIKNNSKIDNTISLPCTVSDCSVNESSWPQCEDVLEKSWTPWEYLSCIEIGVGNETILCGGGHRARSREVRTSSANPWRSEDVTEQCQHCSLSFDSILGGQKMTITPAALENALNNSMDISNPIHTIVLEKSWAPWEYLSCTEIGVGNETILCGSGHRSRSREVRSSSANPWRNESVTEPCQHCSVSFASISEGQKMTITPPALGNALNNSMNISNPILCSVGGTWELGMNINPCDGGNFGYGGPWSHGVDVGTSGQAFTKDFLNIDIWKKPAGFVTIARHVDGQCTMSKTWELTNKTKSMYSYFSTYPGRIYATGDGSRSDNHIASDIPQSAEGLTGAWRDPIFGADGGLVFNWRYSDNGARIAVPGGYKVPYSLPGTNVNNEDVHGLGNTFSGVTINGGGGNAWYDVGKIGPDCSYSTCELVGTDHADRSDIRDGSCWGSYAIFVSQAANSFNCQGRALSTMERE